jgi:hypothetical protein
LDQVIMRNFAGLRKSKVCPWLKEQKTATKSNERQLPLNIIVARRMVDSIVPVALCRVVRMLSSTGPRLLYEDIEDYEQPWLSILSDDWRVAAELLDAPMISWRTSDSVSFVGDTSFSADMKAVHIPITNWRYMRPILKSHLQDMVVNVHGSPSVAIYLDGHPRDLCPQFRITTLPPFSIFHFLF